MNLGGVGDHPLLSPVPRNCLPTSLGCESIFLGFCHQHRSVSRKLLPVPAGELELCGSFAGHAILFFSPLSKQYIFMTKTKDTQEIKLLVLLLLGGETISVPANGGRGPALSSRGSEVGAQN